MSDYRVQLDVFSGPMDLLLYLIRRDEVDIQDIPISRLTDQYVQYVHLLEQLDPNAIGDFLVFASTLIELKSRALLPTPPLEALEESDDPRASLVRQLLEYKRFKDAARALGSAADERAARFVRKPVDLPIELQGVELEEAQVWDLLAAFGKVMTAVGRGPGHHDVRYDEMPIEQHADYIVHLISRSGPTTFANLFDDPQDRSTIIGRFLALLELLRNQRVRAEQDKLFGTIYLFLYEPANEPEIAPSDAPSEEAAIEPKITVADASDLRNPAAPAPGIAPIESPDDTEVASPIHAVHFNGVSGGSNLDEPNP